MTFEELSQKNLDTGIYIQNTIFPDEKADADLKDSISGNMSPRYFFQKYWLIKDKNQYLGICGLYAYKEYPKDAWLGWFGIFEEHRREGHGSEAISYCAKQAKKLGFEHLRLYTYKTNDVAQSFYTKFGMTSEIYNRQDDKHIDSGGTLIFSKNLNRKKVSPWANRNLYLLEHDKENNFG